MLFEGLSVASRWTAFEYFKTMRRDEQTVLENMGAAFVIGAVTQGVLCSKLFAHNIINHTEEALAWNRKEFKMRARSPLIERSPILWMRGGILGLISLSFYDALLNFLEENRLNLVQKQDKY